MPHQSWFLLTLSGLLFLLSSCSDENLQNRPNANGEFRPRVFVTTDITNRDRDDQQSLAHLFFYLDQVRLRGIAPDNWEKDGVQATREAIAAYQFDFSDSTSRFREMHFPSPDSVQNLVARDSLHARRMLIQEAHVASRKDPLYMLVWGQMETLKGALFADPSITPNLRVISIATGIKSPLEAACGTPNQNNRGRNAIFNDMRFRELWWLENDWTYSGLFEGIEPEQMLDSLARFGALGRFLQDTASTGKSPTSFHPGGAPSLLYLIDEKHNPDFPEESGWAGRFMHPFPDIRPHYWTGVYGNTKWNYAAPCASWDEAKNVYNIRIQTMLDKRPEMYAALLGKLRRIYR